MVQSRTGGTYCESVSGGDADRSCVSGEVARMKVRFPRDEWAVEWLFVDGYFGRVYGTNTRSIVRSISDSLPQMDIWVWNDPPDRGVTWSRRVA